VTQRRLLATAFFSAVIVAVLAVIVYTEHSNASQTVAVWILAHDVVGGAPYNASDVQQVTLHAQVGDFNYETRGPGALQARYARNLAAHDVLRADDLVAEIAQTEIALTIQNPPPLAVGDHIDIFATVNSTQEALIGRNMIVESVAAGSLTILVPTGDELSWVAVSSSNVALRATRTISGGSVAAPPLGADQAIRILCGPACGASSASPAPP
jgi:hypothetical protein